VKEKRVEKGNVQQKDVGTKNSLRPVQNQFWDNTVGTESRREEGLWVLKEEKETIVL
jgi:hypothetical protein